jgi:hypothetical protein
MFAKRKSSQRKPSDPRAARELAIALAIGAIGALAAFDASPAGPDPLAALTWIATIAVAGGALAATLGVRLLPYGLVAPGTWMIVIALVGASSRRELPTPLYAALAWTGLFAAGHATSALFRRRWCAMATVLLASACLIGLPGKGGLAREPWPGEVARRLLDVSPAALVCESAGVTDWMWRRGNYAFVGVDRFQREPWRGELAGPTVLVLGCLVALGARAVERSRDKPPKAE